MTGSRRVAATVRSGDIVRLADGSAHTVVGNPSPDRSPIGGLTLSIKFADGGGLRVNAGAELDIERPQ
ncbi:hypothetical protein ACFPK5_00435 [Streptomyces beijiangensis]|uniref:hypothetical protein n=1 Tax=Streptomyces beijiangensis TaxID=163361 RepID=UPI0031DE38FC